MAHQQINIIHSHMIFMCMVIIQRLMPVYLIHSIIHIHIVSLDIHICLVVAVVGFLFRMSIAKSSYPPQNQKTKKKISIYFNEMETKNFFNTAADWNAIAVDYNHYPPAAAQYANAGPYGATGSYIAEYGGVVNDHRPESPNDDKVTNFRKPKKKTKTNHFPFGMPEPLETRENRNVCFFCNFKLMKICLIFLFSKHSITCCHKVLPIYRLHIMMNCLIFELHHRLVAQCWIIAIKMN